MIPNPLRAELLEALTVRCWEDDDHNDILTPEAALEVIESRLEQVGWQYKAKPELVCGMRAEDSFVSSDKWEPVYRFKKKIQQ